MLAPVDDLHLVTCNPTEFNDIHAFETFGSGEPSRIQEVRILDSYLRAHDPSVIVHITQPPVHGTMVGLLAKKYDVPAVYRYAGDRFHQFRLYTGFKRIGLYGMNNILGRLPLYLANKFIALGPHGRGRLVAYGAPPEHVRVLPPAVDPARFEGDDRVELDIPDNRDVAIFLGRISRLKGIETIERTLGRVLDRRPNLQFVFVGGEERRPDVPSRYEDNLLFVGRIPPDEVPAYLRRADLLVHPSLTEGIPRAVLESLFAGTPVIARDVGDTASVTENTFRTDEELIEMICSYEDLPLDDPSPFSVGPLSEKYQNVFKYFVDSSTHNTALREKTT